MVERVVVQQVQVIVTAVPAPTEAPQLQEITVPTGEEPIDGALLREAQDQ